MRTWVNGDLLTDPDAPVVSARDHGLTVGDGVFEVLKVVDGTPFATDLHLARLSRSALGLGLPEPDHDEVRRGMEAVLGGEPLALGRLRITWTGGLSPLGSDRGGGPPSLVVVAAPMDPLAGLDSGGDRALATQRARGARRPQDHVVRRERACPCPGP